jgi:hypothetical protein
VPTTSVFSCSDGVVAWQACVDPCDHASAQNIEVEASHIGLVWHPKVWSVVADRLALAEGEWEPWDDLSTSRLRASGLATGVSARAGRLVA